MEDVEIDWSRDLDDILEDLERSRKARIFDNIRIIDEMHQQLEENDIFNHVSFRKIRRRIGSQQDWADQVGVSQATVGNYERNVTYPNKPIRRSFRKALAHFREREAAKLDRRGGVETDIDPVAAKNALRETILQAALTDFDFDAEEQKVVAVPFAEDIKTTEIEAIEQSRRDLLEALSDQGHSLAGNLEKGANANVERLVSALRDYAAESQEARPNPRKLLRWGTNIARAAVSDEITFGITEWDRNALEGFVDDHQELMRLYYREALAKAQQVEAAFVPEDVQLPNGEEFRQIAGLIEDAADDDGQKLFDEDISTLLRDIAREIQEHAEAELLTSDAERRKIIRRRRVEAIKNGSILVGRFLIFTSFFIAVDPLVALGAAGSIASILGLIEANTPGTIRQYYEKLRQALPFLPRFPSK